MAGPLGASSRECLHWTRPIACTTPGAASYCYSCCSRLYDSYIFRKRNPNSERLRFTQATLLVRSSVRAPIHLPVSKPPRSYMLSFAASWGDSFYQERGGSNLDREDPRVPWTNAFTIRPSWPHINSLGHRHLGI